MSDQNLRSKLIRLAHQNPELRAHLLPLLKTSSTVQYTMPIKEQALNLFSTARHAQNFEEEEAAFLKLIEACSTYARKGLQNQKIMVLLNKVGEILATDLLPPELRDQISDEPEVTKPVLYVWLWTSGKPSWDSVMAMTKSEAFTKAKEREKSTGRKMKPGSLHRSKSEAELFGGSN